MRKHASWLSLSLLLVLGALSAAAQGGSQEDAAICVGGDSTAPIKIEVFSDFQCPACRSFYLETIRPVLADYASANKVCVVYREFPLRNHQHSRKAARYAEAARRVGVWQWVQVTDRLYLDQSRWSQDGTVEAAVARALSPEDFAKVKEILQSPSIDASIDRDLQLARQFRVRSTPTFIIYKDGHVVDQRAGVVPFAVLKRTLDFLLAQ